MKTFFIFFGPPGSGKGTQVQLTAKRLKLPVISTGDLLRLELKKRSALGKRAKKYMAAGRLVPDELLEALVTRRLKKPDARGGAIFDGYPRTKNQQRFLLKLLAGIGKTQAYDTTAILIDVSDRAVKARLGSRRACICGAVYNLKTKPPKRADICDLDGKKLFIRDDDKPKVIADRLKVYHGQSQPLLNYWRKQGKLIKVDGERSIGQVDREVGRVLRENGFKI